jgi:AbrB family looped-hinge helix DNA binding protein
METTKLTTRGHVTIPKSIRQSRHWEPGEEFVVEERPEGVLFKPKERKSGLSAAEVFGCLHYEGPPKTLKEMEEGIRRGAQERR